MFFKIEHTDSPLSPREQSKLARRLLRDLLASHYALPSLPEIAIAANGKPYFPSHPDIHFSLSHCKVAVMAAVDSKEIGCDIEEIQIPFPQDILEIAFSRQEKAMIMSSRSPEQKLTAIWTRKEATVKRNGDIPDDPINWPSDAPHLMTRILPEFNYVFSIAFGI